MDEGKNVVEDERMRSCTERLKNWRREVQVLKSQLHQGLRMLFCRRCKLCRLSHYFHDYRLDIVELGLSHLSKM
jgi:hypothetical protein